MRKEVKEAIYSTECVDAINRFTDTVRGNLHSCAMPDRELDTIRVQTAKRMEPVRNFMDTLQHLPLIGALLFRTT